jgi:acetyl-CoA carboxylase biotin carboxyl carrier protein
MNPLDLRKIKKLIELVEASGISELEVRNGEESIRIVRPLAPAPLTGPGSAPRWVSPNESNVARGARAAAGFVVYAPLTGTFYCAPAPGERAFVRVGQSVAVGDVLCIIESMKMMNQIEAERVGRIVEVLAEDGAPVETGAPLFRIE